MNKVAQSGEEYNDIATTLIQLLHSIYISKGDPEKEEILEKVFDHLYGDFLDSEKGFKQEKAGSPQKLAFTSKGSSIVMVIFLEIRFPQR